MTEHAGHNVAGAQLQPLVERIERLNEEKAEVAEQIKEVYDEAKAFGFDKKILRMVIRRRQMAREALAEVDALLETYESVLK